MHFYVYKDKKGEWRWKLRAKNGKIIADSGEGYKRRRDCVNGAQLLMSLPEQFAGIVVVE